MKENQDFIMKPKVDFCFKELMNDAKVRQGFLAALLGLRPEDIVETVLMPTHLSQQFEEDKLGILDVRVLLNNRAQINIEIQIAPFRAWPERSLFYWSKMYIEQIKAGDPYDKLDKCIHVGILDFDLFPDDEQYFSSFHLSEDDRNQLYTDKIEIHILELGKLKRYEYPENELLSWAKFMNAEHRKELEAMSEKNEYLGKACETLINLSSDEQKRLEYEAREKAIRDHNYLINYSLEEGRRIGLEEGLKEGLKEGLEKGASDLIVSLTLKKAQKGLTPAEIADILEVDLSEVKEIYALWQEHPEFSEEEIKTRFALKK